MRVHWRNQGEFSEAERVAAEARVAALDEEHHLLGDVHIAAKPTRHHRHGGQEVRISCRFHGHEIVGSRTSEVSGKALDEILDLLKREVHRLRDRDRHRRQGRTHAQMRLR